MKSLLGTRHNLTAVGDDDQSIYSWRGAATDNLDRLAQDFPNLKVVKLEQNYRSTGRILQAANTVIAQNPHHFEKRLWSTLGDGHGIRALRCANEVDEAEQVVNIILRDRFQRQGEYRDYAILYRSNHQARPFETALRNARIPYQISGGLSFFERSEIKDFLSYLRLLVNPDDDPAFLRAVNTPRRGIGSSTMERLGAFAKEHDLSLFAALWDDALDIPDKARIALHGFAGWINLKADEVSKTEVIPALRRLPEEIGYLQYLQNEEDEKDTVRRWENIQELLNWMQRLQEQDEGPQTLAEMLSRLMLFNVLEREEDDDRDVLRLSTLHAAKGLEFPQVFLVGAEEELLPHRNSETPEQIQEERRLFYVGMTRARFRLTLSLCHKRRRYGQDVYPEPSRFLQEIPKEHLDWQGDQNPEEEMDPSTAFARLREMLSKT